MVLGMSYGVDRVVCRRDGEGGENGELGQGEGSMIVLPGSNTTWHLAESGNSPVFQECPVFCSI